MTHRFFVAPDQIDGETVSFSAAQAHQLRSVLRLRAGDGVLVFDGRASVDQVVILTADARGRITATVPHAAEPATRLVAYPALLQRDKFEQVLQKLTEVGVAAVVPVLTARSVVREPPDERRQTRWRAILREAAEQSGRGTIPQLTAAVPFADAIAQATAEGVTLVGYEQERQQTLRTALTAVRPAQRARTVGIFVGPEGGYTPDEAAVAQRAGAHLITLGPRILRTETASPILAALVLYELGDLSSPHAIDDRP